MKKPFKNPFRHHRAKNRNKPRGYSPTQIICVSFVIVIALGTLLLSLPIASRYGRMRVIDAMFTATSATCVTGLVVRDTWTQFTVFGQAVILVLIQVGGLEYASMRRKETPESSADVKCRVDAARAVQTARFAGTGVTCNAHMTAPMIGQFCCLDHAGDALMKSAFERMGLTARSHDRILRVARTIADLDGAADIRPEHLAEAIQFRNTDILKG